MGNDYAPVSQDEDELEPRSRYLDYAAEGQYPPVAPAPASPAPAASASGYPPVESPAAPVSAIGSLGDLEARTARPKTAIQDEAPPPVTPRPQWKDYAPAQPTSRLGKFGHALEEMFTPLPRLAEQRAERNYKNANAEYDAPAAEAEKQSETELHGAQTEEARARAKALNQPPEKTGLTPEETTIHDLMTGENGQPRLNPQTNKPYTYLEAFGAVKQAAQDTKPQKPDRPDTPEQQFIDAEVKKGKTIEQAVKDYAASTQKSEKEPKGEMFVDPTGKVIEIKAGMTVPAGAKPLSKAGQPTADEQRRNDLATNLNENLDQLEDIVKRRPELFGPLAGRWSELKSKFGSNDPDISALSVLEHQIGMAQISAHGMRSAHGIEGAAQSIINGLHSGPAALMGAIATVRKSVGTFQQDVANARGQEGPKGAESKTKDLGPAPQGKPEGATGTLPDGTKVVVKGGRIVAQ